MKKALVIGGDRGLGLAICKHLNSEGVEVLATSRKHGSSELIALGAEVLSGIDLLEDEAPEKLCAQLEGRTVDAVYHVAGYFTQEGALVDLNREEERKMFEICAIAPVFIFAALLKHKNIQSGSKIAFITSEGGSIGLRTLKEGGKNYGHHMSKAAANMAGKIAAYDLHPHGIPLVMIHPGFLKTNMTADKYADHYESLGAVTAEYAAPYVVACLESLTLESTGRFVAAMGSKGFGYGVYALPLSFDYPQDIPPGGEIPW